MQYMEMRKGRVEIIPMIDIMLFLLVFFIMVTLRMIPAQGLPAHLPGSSTAQQLPKPKVTLALHKGGALEMDGKVITLPALTAQLHANQPADTQVTIAASRGVPVQDLVLVMDACRAAGVNAIGLAATPLAP